MQSNLATEIQARDDDRLPRDEDLFEPPEILRLPERAPEVIAPQGLPMGHRDEVALAAQFIGGAA